MTRVCNGCLQAKAIVNEKDGYCEYCDRQRNLQVKDILAKVDSKQFNLHLEAIKALSEKDRKFELELMLKYEGRAVSYAYLEKLQELTKKNKQAKGEKQ